MGLKDNKQTILIIGSEDDIRDYKNNETIDILEDEYTEYHNELVLEHPNIDWIKPYSEHEVVEIGKNHIYIDYPIIEEGISIGEPMDSISKVCKHIDTLYTKYPNLYFIHTMVYDRADFTTYILNYRDVIESIHKDTKLLKKDKIDWDIMETISNSKRPTMYIKPLLLQKIDYNTMTLQDLY